MPTVYRTLKTKDHFSVLEIKQLKCVNALNAQREGKSSLWDVLMTALLSALLCLRHRLPPHMTPAALISSSVALLLIPAHSADGETEVS